MRTIVKIITLPTGLKVMRLTNKALNKTVIRVVK